MYCASALIGIAMTACTANEEVRVSSDGRDVIGFSVETPNLTRAAHSFCNNVTPDCFRVQAYDGATAYFDQVDIVSKSGDKWQSNNDRYWPDDENKELTFYAYVDDIDMNYSGTMGNLSGGTFSTNAIATDGAPKFVNYEVNSVINQQRDLMYAVGIGKKADNAPVQLNFRHALSQICFTAENMDPSTKEIFICNIEVGGLKGKGTYTFPSKATETGPDDHANPAVDKPTDAKSGTWLLADEVANPYVLSNFANNGLSYKTAESTDAPVNLSKPTSAVHTGEYVFDYAMNLIPQNIEAYFKVTFKKKGTNETDYGAEQSVTIPVHVDWKEGMRYVYNLIWSRTGISYAVAFADYNEVDPETTSAVNGYKKVLMRNAYTDDEGNYHAPLYFADRNVGASSPEEAGLFFWWGDTDGHYYKDGILYKHDKSAESRTLAEVFSENIPTCNASTLDVFLDSQDKLDFKNYHLNLAHDAARLKMGGLWRIPEYDELDWLDTNSTWTKVFDSENKFLGYMVKSNDTGNEIFLPNCHDIQDGEYRVNYNTCYWSSSIYSEEYYPSYNNGHYYSCGIYIEPNGTHPDYVFNRNIGGQIRAVCNE